MFERGGEEVFAGDEHDDVVGRVGELAPIGLVAEPVDVRAHRGCVCGEADQAFGVIDRAERVLVRVERNLRVDDQCAAAGDADDRVGAQSRAVITDSHR